MIRLISDSAGLWQEDGTLVASVSEYVRAYRSLHEAMHLGTHLTLVVRNDTCALWLSRAAGKYGSGRVLESGYTARQSLMDAWGLSILPDDLVDADIVRDGLLERQLTAKSGQTFEGLVLEWFYGSLFTSTRLPVGKLGHLLASVDPDVWDENGRIASVRRTFVAQMTRWLETASNSAEADLIYLIRDDPSEAVRLAERAVLVERYPESVRTSVLAGQANTLTAPKYSLEGLVPGAEAADRARPHIVVWLSSHRQAAVTPRERLRQLLEVVSGYLAEEFEELCYALRADSTLATPETIARIKRLFRPISHTLGHRLTGLSARPSFPSSPVATWKPEEWLSWVRSEYLPYRSWCDENDGETDELQALSTAFSDWLFEYRDDVRIHCPLEIHHVLESVTDAVTKAGVTLLIIADNLGFRFWPLLERAFGRAGFAPTDVQARFAALPTTTAVSKKCLCGGTERQIDVASDTYEALVGRWSARLSGGTVHYAANVGKLKDVSAHAGDLVVLNYLPVDETLHKDVARDNLSHGDTVENLLEALADGVREWSTGTGSYGRLTIYVTADHGSVRVGGRPWNVIDTRHFKHNVACEGHHRFVRLNAGDSEEIAGNYAYQAYALSAAQDGLDSDYLVARSEHWFMPSQAGTYQHGGLSPEEVVVPFVRLAAAASQIARPVVTLLGSRFRFGTKESIQIQVTNSSDVALHDMECRFTAPGLRSGVAFAAEIPPRSALTLVTEGRFSAIEEDVTSLSIDVAYVPFGHEDRAFSFEVPVVVQSIMTKSERRFR